MKKIVFLAAFLIPFATTFTQPTHDEEISYVDSFTNDSLTTPLYLYDSKGGTVIDSVLPSQYGMCYTLVLIKKIEGDWVQIQSIRHAPCPSDSLLNSFVGKWLYKTDLFFDIGNEDETGISIYKSASKKKILTTIYEFQTVKIIDVYGSWAKVEYIADSNKKIVGWIYRFDQCAARWTTCNWEE